MNNLKKYRAVCSLTMQELADRVGMSRTGLGLAENGHLCVDLAKKCSKELKVNVFELLGEDVFTILPSTQEDFDSIEKTLKGLRKKYVLDLEEENK